MTRHMLPTRVPCSVCLTTITGWDGDRAEPCGHTLDDIGAVWSEAAAQQFDVGALIEAR